MREARRFSMPAALKLPFMEATISANDCAVRFIEQPRNIIYIELRDAPLEWKGPHNFEVLIRGRRYDSFAMRASVNSAVLAVPPRSRVRVLPSAMTEL